MRKDLSDINTELVNYVMPGDVYSKIHDKRKLRLLGFLSHGTYGQVC